jgi:hypothetical protein
MRSAISVAWLILQPAYRKFRGDRIPLTGAAGIGVAVIPNSSVNHITSQVSHGAGFDANKRRLRATALVPAPRALMHEAMRIEWTADSAIAAEYIAATHSMHL